MIFLQAAKSSSNTSNSDSGNFTLKYEIITSSPVVDNGITTLQKIGYYNGTGQAEYDNSFTSGTKWSKTLTVTTQNRPFTALLEAVNLSIGGVGTVTGNIYVNGSLVATTTNPINNLVILQMYYIIQ